MEEKESGGGNTDGRPLLVPDAKVTLMQAPVKQKSNEPLVNVIQKLTAMVKSQELSNSSEGNKRPYPDDVVNAPPSKEPELVNPSPKRVKEDHPRPQAANSPTPNNKKVMFYQCSLCKFISPSFEILTLHVKNHGQHNEIILMCSECHLTFKTHAELETHIKTHCENDVTAPSQSKNQPQEEKQASPCADGAEPARKKWYAYEAYGLYRCLICRYTCGQQRMLKTHAWKHAGEVDFSYPIFEEENESAGLPDSTVAHTPQGSESVLSENLYVKQQVQVSGCDTVVQEQNLVPMDVQLKRTEVLSQTSAPTPMTEVVVVDGALPEKVQDSLIRDSLLSSAQKIISCSQSTKGHMNVIVERLPGAEASCPQKPFLIGTEVDVKKTKKVVAPEAHLAGAMDVYHADKNMVETEEIIIGFEGSDQNSPPVRRRTNSECLRLHSLAAEALVTMPIRVVECPKTTVRLIRNPSPIDPDTGQGDGGEDDDDDDVTFVSCTKVEPPKVAGEEESVVQKEEKFDLAEAPMKMGGISMSLLKVIEKLRERTDQNATDDDILKELQDNAQSECTGDLGPNTNLVEYLPDAERPFRCRLCHYTSDNKGYIKQHLRVHRQRQPYQCPICEHKAENSGDLENHMINHCKTIKYECKHCKESFYYKSQLRSHEREHRGGGLDTVSTTSDETPVCMDEVEDKLSPEDKDEDPKSSVSKLYRCDVCSYTSSTYVGVRNHRRIHSSDKPYRCSLCGYVCSHPPSLKSHMWKHASDQNYNYEQVNKAINEAMSQSSRVQSEPSKDISPPNEASARSESDGAVPASHSAPDVTYTENPKVNSPRPIPCNAEKPQNQLRPGTELCVLLFCCCICGFESTSKDLLMEHMKAHEGEIINIILNKSEGSS